ncbi:ProQ/FINO family protein [Polaromonas sp. JS666]|uniref:ProQ/FINO family protein n=1 Tax=Polaromonas sp. (strain JS666 / ATCC BAA-500) TaxID=296591 RepID=UPI00004640F0|nr:ProQ/FINO family protein [Polaromonas sp. JS666]
MTDTDTNTPPAPSTVATPVIPASPDTPATSTRAPRSGRARGRQAGKQPSTPPRTRQVHPALEKLFELYPKMFGAQFLPLKLGVFQELLAQHPDAFNRDELKVALGLHARSTRYLESVAAGLPRHDLQGEPVEPVAPEHVHHAILEVFRRRQARSREDLRPALRQRLMQAIEASGLSREDYSLCVRTQDEASNALIDDAFTELGRQAAKREALMKAFEASGRTVEQFADMYGMGLAEVTQALDGARRDRGGLAA